MKNYKKALKKSSMLATLGKKIKSPKWFAARGNPASDHTQHEPSPGDTLHEPIYDDTLHESASEYLSDEGVDKSDLETATWRRHAAKQGHAWAQNNLGLMYEYGKGLPLYYEEAVKWYRKAAEQGLAKARFNLGLLYANEEGTENTLEEAGWWEETTNKDDSSVVNRKPVKDYVEAYAWLNLVATQLPGGNIAQETIATITKKMSPSQNKKAKDLSGEYARKYGT